MSLTFINALFCKKETSVACLLKFFTDNVTINAVSANELQAIPNCKLEYVSHDEKSVNFSMNI